ncbi:MAG: STAUR_1299 family protein [Myxococcales bacterium]
MRELVQDAFSEAAAQDANVAISRVRRQRAGGDPDDEDAPGVRSYEIILAGFEAFARDLLPKLVYHLESIGAHLPQCRGVMIAAFAGERLYFIEAQKFVARVCRMLGVSAEELVRRHGTGERRTAVPAAPLLLPGPKGRA